MKKNRASRVAEKAGLRLGSLPVSLGSGEGDSFLLERGVAVIFRPRPRALLRGDVNQKGFTLLEVMVALSIIVIVLTALIGTQSQGVSLAIESKFQITAALLAQDRISEIALMEDDLVSSDSGDFGEDFSPYQWALEVEQVDIPGLEAAEGRLLRLDLTVFLEDDDKFQYKIRQYRFVNETGQ